MQTTNINTTPLAELSPAPTLSEGRLKWESDSAGKLIGMFAVAGYDVIRNDVMPDGPTTHNRLVKDQDGRIVAYVLWCDSIPNYAYAYSA